MSNSLCKTLAAATIERQVEDAYNHALEKEFSGLKLEYPFACDGYCEFEVDGKTHRLLIEYKYDEDIQSSVAKAKVLAQVLFYLKRFEKNGRPLPNVCMIADKNECFVMHTNALLKYLDFENVDWDKAPSGAGGNGDLVLALSEDKDINPFVFDVDEGFDFDVVVQKLKDLASGTVRLVRVTEHNVDKIFKMFSEKIVLDKKYPPNDMVALFFNVVTGSEDVYLHPTKKNTLVVNGKNVRVDSSKFKAFCGHFSTTCSPKEKARLAAISDRLIEDTNRRRKGEFYTPTNFVDFCQNLLTINLGENWRDEYVCYDNCCGTKNLTRDYKFKELYCSTLEQAELNISKNYNTEACSFQFDFLNDELKRVSEGGKVPDGLIDALEQNKKICFLLNPPYATGSGLHTNEHSTGTHKTQVLVDMENEKIGGRSSNLYTQFIYRISKIQRIYNLTNCVIGIFCPPSFLNGQNYKGFRQYLFKHFEFKHGIQFDSAHFTDVAFGAIMFSIWKNGQTKHQIITDIVDDTDDGIKVQYQKEMYNVDNLVGCNKWFREKNNNPIIRPTFKNAITISDSKNKSDKNAIGYFYAHGNNIFQSPQRTGIFSSPFQGNQGTNIFESNFDKCMTSFAARLICDKDAYNQFDEFMAPNVNDPHWQEFVNDSIVYSLFNGKSQQSSLRQVSYHNKLWDIKNEFFWCNPKDVAEWANDCNNDEVYNDANTMPESFVYKKLQTITLSAEAQAVLDKANELLKKSMKYRKLFNDEHPEVQIQNADAGFYQLKQMLKEYMPDELKEFKELYKKLAEKMKPAIYEFGFLRK